jgi:hypothetical protein
MKAPPASATAIEAASTALKLLGERLMQEHLGEHRKSLPLKQLKRLKERFKRRVLLLQLKPLQQQQQLSIPFS